MADTVIYKRLAQAIIKADGKIGDDTARFVGEFVSLLRKQGLSISGDAEAALNTYLGDMEAALKVGIAESVAIGAGLGVTVASLQSAEVLAMAEQAFAARWPDGLTLSERLWRWKKSARDGVQQQLQAGIKQGKSVDAVVYAMQRAIERDAGQRFKIVSDHADKWVEDLHGSAVSMLHNPSAKAEWQKVVDDVEARIAEMARTGNRNAAERLLSQIKKGVDTGQERILDQAIKWWTYDQQLYGLRRIVRTEMATAAHQAVIDGSSADPSIIGYQWRLSASHPVTDICDYYANIEMGLGKGVFSKDAVPRHKAHPHCMCLLIPRVSPIAEKGDKNYADFIRNTSPERRATLLPEWAKKAVDRGLPIDTLLRHDGFGLLSKHDAQDLVNQHTVATLVAKLAKKANNANSLDTLWANGTSLKGHIAKRVKLGHIADEADYFNKVKLALTQADKFNFVDSPKYPLLELVGNTWSVILNQDGLIKTAYLHEQHLKSFTHIQTQKGHTVYGHAIGTGLGKQLKQLFGGH